MIKHSLRIMPPIYALARFYRLLERSVHPTRAHMMVTWAFKEAKYWSVLRPTRGYTTTFKDVLQAYLPAVPSPEQSSAANTCGGTRRLIEDGPEASAKRIRVA